MDQLKYVAHQRDRMIALIQMHVQGTMADERPYIPTTLMNLHEHYEARIRQETAYQRIRNALPTKVGQ